MDYSLLNEIDSEIEESINNLRNAKYGADVKVAILKYEELMYKREKEFVRLVMEERKTGNLKRAKEEPIVGKTTQETIFFVQNVEKDVSEAKKKSHEALIWSFVALGSSILQIVLKELGLL